MKDKILIISHGFDVDEAMPVILANLVYEDVTSIFLEASARDDKIIELLFDKVEFINEN